MKNNTLFIGIDVSKLTLDIVGVNYANALMRE